MPGAHVQEPTQGVDARGACAHPTGWRDAVHALQRLLLQLTSPAYWANVGTNKRAASNKAAASVASVLLRWT